MSSRLVGETSYRETAFGIIPRSRLIPLEIEGIKRAWDFVLKKRARRKLPLTPTFLKEIHLDLPPVELKIETPIRRRRYVRALGRADEGDYRDLQMIIRAAFEEVAEEL